MSVFFGYLLGFLVVAVFALLLDAFLRMIEKHTVSSIRLGTFPINVLLSTYKEHPGYHLIHLFGCYFLTDKFYIIKADRCPTKEEIKKLKDR